jgi:hypothetical protein
MRLPWQRARVDVEINHAPMLRLIALSDRVLLKAEELHRLASELERLVQEEGDGKA